MKFIPLSLTFKNLIFLLVLTGLGSCSTTRWQSKADDQAQMLADITYLAADKLEGRTFGSKGERMAGDYIARRYKQLGLKPMGEKGTWFQTITVKGNNPHSMELGKAGDADAKTGRNVIGYLDHGAPFTVVLGAHYDHLGYGHFGSLYVGEPAIHNGADDNASGVALILEMAQRLQGQKKFNYLFIAFTGEENGLWGSNYFCKNPTIDITKVTAMLNFDMVGRLSENRMAINGTGTSPAWDDLLNVSNIYGLSFAKSASGIGPSDHTSFYLVDVPAIHFFTGAHEDYHKPSDDVHLINAQGLEMIADMISKLLLMMDANEKLPFTKTKDPDPSSTPRMEVTLGILPDYLYDGEGMRLDGVREGRPAELAGMAKGDIILRIGEKKIKDIYAYMEALGHFHKGDKTSLIALRDGKEVRFDIQF